MLTKPEGGCFHVNGSGWVSRSANVAPTAFVCSTSRVLDNAEVLGKAEVRQHVIIKGNASVSGNSKLSYDLLVGGDTKISGNSIIEGRRGLELIHGIHLTGNTVLRTRTAQSDLNRVFFSENEYEANVFIISYPGNDQVYFLTSSCLFRHIDKGRQFPLSTRFTDAVVMPYMGEGIMSNLYQHNSYILKNAKSVPLCVAKTMFL